jgi:hypothetical protein
MNNKKDEESSKEMSENKSRKANLHCCAGCSLLVYYQQELNIFHFPILYPTYKPYTRAIVDAIAWRPLSVLLAIVASDVKLFQIIGPDPNKLRHHIL